MRIAIVTPVVVRNDGQGRVNYEIARAALERGHEVYLVSSAVDPDLTRHANARWAEIARSSMPTQLLRDLVFAARSARWLRTHRSGLDAVLVNGAVTWARADLNAVHFVHGAWRAHAASFAAAWWTPLALYHRLYAAVHAWAEQIAFRRARTIVAVSDRVRADLEAVGVPSHAIAVVNNGVDLEEFAPGPADRTALGLPEDVPLALFVGDLRTPRKNLDTVLRALVLAPALHLAVVGTVDGSPYPSLAQSLGLCDRVHFLGFRRDVPALLRAADLCLCPSRYEPFSLVLLEAMASGCPVVTTRAVGASALVPPEAGIVLEDPEDASALASALRSLAGDPGRRQSMAQAARRTATSYGWDATAAGYLRLLERNRAPTTAPSL